MPQSVPAVLFPAVSRTYTFDTEAFALALRKSGLSHREFARRAGWAQSYQQKLVTGEIKSIPEANAKVILQVLAEAAVVTRDYVGD